MALAGITGVTSLSAAAALGGELQGLRARVEAGLAQTLLASASESPGWHEGERLDATVTAPGADGGWQIHIGSQMIEAQLPPGTQVGDRLGLRFLSAQPRLTFALLSQTPAQAAPVEPAISQAARDLGRVMNAILQPGEIAAPGLRASAPLLSSAPAGAGAPAELPVNLRQALSSSGLFYEAHQAEWTRGERPLQALLQEPQGRLAPLQDPPTRLAPLQDPPTRLTAPEAPQSAAVGETPTSVPAAASGAAGEAPRQHDNAVHAEALGLVREQLASLDRRQVQWAGEAWPGQPMQWEVDDPTQRSGGDTALPQWHSRLSLDFPRLGPIVAELSLVGQQARLVLRAGQAPTVAEASAARAELAQRLAASGLSLGGFSVAEGVDG